MERLRKGIHRFRQENFHPLQDLFEKLGHGQDPDTLFITCSDSRIDPNLLTKSKPGELFILRNAGNIIPTHGVIGGGETATVEFAVSVLNVKDIIICGHYRCGAMKALLQPSMVEELPEVGRWLRYAETTRRIMKENYTHLQGQELEDAAVEENVLVQLENLETLPSVASRLRRGELRLYGWVYRIETGEVVGYDSDAGEFVPIETYRHPASGTPSWQRTTHAI